jgi:TonB family protein
MLDSYSMQRTLPVGRLSAGFGGAFFVYGSLILAVFVLQNSEQILGATSKPTRLVMILPSLPPAAPAPAMAKASNSAAPVLKTEAPKPVKPEIAPKVAPTNEPAEKPQLNNAATTNNSLAKELEGAGSPDGDLFSGKPCGGDTGSPCGTTPCGGTTGNPCGTDPSGVPGGDPGQPLPDEGGPVPFKVGMVAPKRIASQCPLPEYPTQARAAGLTGVVKLHVTVSRQGKVTKANILEGPEIFQEVAKSYLESCAFTPALFNGQAISVTKLETVNFTLR